MKDEQGKTTLICGHECTVYAGMTTSGTWSKQLKCCECAHTSAEKTCIYIDGHGEQPCPRGQFYCAACVRRVAPNGATMWDAGKMTRVLVFEPGTRTLMSAMPKSLTQTAATSQVAATPAAAAAAAPAAWLSMARQTLQAVKLVEQVEPGAAVGPVLDDTERCEMILRDDTSPPFPPTPLTPTPTHVHPHPHPGARSPERSPRP